MSIPSYIAQAGSEVALGGALTVYGPLGIITGFFMLVSYKVINLGASLVQAVKDDNAALRTSIERLAHQLQGLRAAILADTLDRETSGHAAKAHARAELAKIEASRRET